MVLRLPPTAPEWGAVALDEARKACEENFSSRRGVVSIEDSDILVVYNNNPYANFPTRRDEETAAFRDWLKAEGMQELAYATYPVEGVDAGYSCAMVIRMREQRHDDVVEAMNRIVRQSNDE